MPAEDIVRRLRQILGKYQQDVGIVTWGTITKKDQGQYRVLLVDDDGKLLIGSVDSITSLGSITDPVDISDRWARELGKVDLQRFLGSDVSLTNPVLESIVADGVIADPRATWNQNADGIKNGSFDYDFAGWIKKPSSNVEITSIDAYSGYKCLRLGPASGSLVCGEVTQFFSPPIDTDRFRQHINDSFIVMKRAATEDYLELVYWYSNGSTDTNHLYNVNPNVWAGQSFAMPDADKYIMAITLRSRDTNTGYLLIDDLSFFVEHAVDLCDKAARVLGIVYQAEKDRTISSMDDVVYTAGGLVNGDFETGNLLGWYETGVAGRISINSNASYVFSGKYSLKINTAGGYLWQFFSPAIKVDDIQLFSMMLQVWTISDLFRLTVYYTDNTTQASTSGTSLAWSVFAPSLTSGKYIAAIKLECTGSAVAYVDQIKLNTYSSNIHSDFANIHSDFGTLNEALGYKSAQEVNEDDTVASMAYVDYIDYSGASRLEHLIVGAVHSDVVIWLGLDDYWYTIVTNEDPSFTDLYDIGGEDNLLKLVQYNKDGVCKAILKRPVEVGAYLYLGIYNPTGSARDVWAGAEYTELG